jgi:diguanylate cyclase (GGDEF)-like protein
MTEGLQSSNRMSHEHGIDPATGLPGRGVLLEKLNALPRDMEVALICIDLDHLASLNEAMGLSAGDNVLAETAKRVATHAEQSNFLARYGGDEFAVLIENVADFEHVSRIASALIEELMRPYLVAGKEVFVGATIGIACTLPTQLGSKEKLQATTIDQALHHAKAALARAKVVSRGSWLLYESGMTPVLGARLHLETELAVAVEQGQFLVYYQPKASCRTGAITGFEALVRWMHPTKGIVPPSEFIPILEETGLIDRVGAWVLRTACQQLATWDLLGHDRLTMAVNVSLRQLVDLTYPDLVKTVLAESGMAPERLELELTESLLMQDVRHTEALLFRLKVLGVRLSIDDFGTGYSSLAYLKRLPIDTVKIDRSFVQDITTNPNDASITRAIIGMARSLKLSLIAEGVETEAQLSKLVAEHCDTVQGYFIGKPMPASDAAALLTSGWCLSPELIGRPTKTRTLLLVDDEESIVSALKRLLRREGYRILSANSGAEGLELLAKNDVDVIVSDQRMPNMTGEEFLRLAKELYPDTVRMVLSGYADMQSITNAINQGAIYKFLSKPWDDQGLKDNILEAFRRKELSDENARLTREIGSMNEDLNRSNKALAVLLDEQARRSLVGQTALSVAQQTLHLLPSPVLGLDPSGMIVLRNEAFVQLGIEEDAIASFAQTLPSWPSTEVSYSKFVDSAGRLWTLAGRNLSSGGQYSGMVFAFFPGVPHE